MISAPQKNTDKRGAYMPDTYQAEALDPDILAGTVRHRLTELVGEENTLQAKAVTEIERAEILASIKKIDDEV